MTDEVKYIGRDLEAMSFAVNYRRWIFEAFAPYLGRRVVEVGAGTGSFSELFLQCNLESLSLVEPSRDMHQKLRAHIDERQPRFRVTFYNDLFQSIYQQIRATEQPDSIMYVNVLEHVVDDRGELRAISEALGQGGCVFIFVPALSWLLGSFDRQVGHHRRYSRGGLEEKCREAGFRVVLSRYFDFPGVLPWWIKYRLLQSEKMEPGAVRFYDKLVVPITRVVESAISPPVGKNVLLVGQKE